jgi:hypothetical protein
MMWLAGFAMLVLSMGYLLMVAVSGKFRDKKTDPAGPERAGGAGKDRG